MANAIKLSFPHIKYVDYITRLINFSASVEKLLNNAANTPGELLYHFQFGMHFV